MVGDHVLNPKDVLVRREVAFRGPSSLSINYLASLIKDVIDDCRCLGPEVDLVGKQVLAHELQSLVGGALMFDARRLNLSKDSLNELFSLFRLWKGFEDH